MRDIETELGDYWAAVVAEYPVPSADELMASSASVAAAGVYSAGVEVCDRCGGDLTVFDLRQGAEPAPAQPSKRWISVVSGVAAVVLLVLGAVISDANRGDVGTDATLASPVTEGVSPPAAADTVSPPLADDSVILPGVGDGLGYRWSRVARGPDIGGFLADVVVGGPGLVAVGFDGRGAAVWTSVDGIDWSRASADDDVFGGARVRAVTAGGPGLVAVGDDRGFAVVWTSVDGITWSRVPRDDDVFRGADMLGVTVGGPGLVAVGGTGSSDNVSNPQVGSAVVWTSVDGIIWSRVPDDEAVFGGPNSQFMTDVTAGGPGLVAVGGDFHSGGWDEGSGSAAVWTSVDGLAWSRVAHDEAVFDGSAISAQFGNAGMLSVTAGGPGLVAGGWAGLWTSVDGLTWSHENIGTVFDIVDTGAGLVAVGDTVWTSVDGLAWSQVPDRPIWGGNPMTAVTVGGPGLVAVGAWNSTQVWVATPETSTNPASEPDPPTSVVGPLGYRWSRAPIDEAVFGETSGGWMASVTAGGPGFVAVGVAVGSAGTEIEVAAVWTSVDGFEWSRVAHDEAVFGGVGGQTMVSVAAGGPGLVAVGFEGKSDGGGTDAVVWTSVDGVVWSRVPQDEGVFDGTYMSGVAVGGPGLVAVGGDGAIDSEAGAIGNAVVWTSVDGVVWSRVPHDEAVFSGLNNQGMVDVTAGGPGLVAVGHDGEDGAVWTSVDGVVWSRVRHDEAVFGAAAVNAVITGGPGLVAVGSWVWTSVDGMTWSRVADVQGSFDRGNETFVQSVTAGVNGLVAVGTFGEDHLDAAVWTSVDGLDWSQVPHDEEVFAGGELDHWMSDVATVGDVAVAVGVSRYDRPDPSVWVAALER